MSGLKLSLVTVASVIVAAGFISLGKNGAAPSAASTATSLAAGKVGDNPGAVKEGKGLHPAKGDELASFSGGCFWGVEEFFRHIPGVVSTAVGYTGGTVPNPSYELVCTHTTGHAETVLVEYNPKKVTYKELVADFWKVHNPTEVDRQGPDVGSNYRSAIWFYNDAQKADALASIAARQKKESGPIVTRVAAAKPFYLAEDYHQQYDEKTGTMSCPVRE